MKKKTKKERLVYANIGCGIHIVPSTDKIKWLNIDKFKIMDSPDFLQGDLLDLPLEKESVDYIYMDQVLEHIPMADVPIALYEVRRVLKKGGRCIIEVPDFKNAVEQWLRYDHDIAFSPLVFQYVSEVIYGNQNHEGEFHKTPMTAGFLHYMLNLVGLKNHKIIMAPEGSPLPQFPGSGPAMHVINEITLRNSQLIADITK